MSLDIRDKVLVKHSQTNKRLCPRIGYYAVRREMMSLNRIEDWGKILEPLKLVANKVVSKGNYRYQNNNYEVMNKDAVKYLTDKWSCKKKM